MSLPPALQSFLNPWMMLVAGDPLLRSIQICMILLGALVIFLVFYATRDILLRTHSFWYTLFCIALVALLPVVGFLMYLLIRPPRTIKDREMEELLQKVVASKKKKSS